MSGATIKKPGITIQKTYEDAELFLSDRDNVNVGDRVRIPAFRVPPAEVEGENKMSFDEIKVKDEYATVYDRDENFLHLVFDRALFRSTVDNNNTKLWCDTQLAQYLRGTFLAALARKTKATDCGLLRKKDLWGKNAKPFFKHGKNRICFDNDEDMSVWYWLETPEDNASAAHFCFAGNYGGSYYAYASRASIFVRPRFTIPILDISQLCAELAFEKTEPKTEEAATDKKHYRPYKDSNEMIEDFKRRYNSYGGWSGRNNPMYCPMIWVKEIDGGKHLIRSFDKSYVIIASVWGMRELFDKFTYLDGTPVGMEE